jgi:Glyoxalase-like domain
MDGKHRREHPRVEETMTATIGLVLDCADPDRLATFWSEALGYTTVGGAGNYVMLVAADGALPKLLLQAVPEPKTTKNGMHLDIETPTSKRRHHGSRRSAPAGSSPACAASTAPTG